MNIEVGELLRLYNRMVENIQKLSVCRYQLNNHINTVNKNVIIGDNYSLTQRSITLGENVHDGINNAITDINKLNEFLKTQISDFELTVEEASTKLKRFVESIGEIIAYYDSSRFTGGRQSSMVDGGYMSLFLPMYSQYDLRWSQNRVTNGNSVQTAGCGYMSFAMVASGLNPSGYDSYGNAIEIEQIIRDVTAINYRTAGKGGLATNVLDNQDLLNKYNLNLYKKDGNPQLTSEEVMERLNAGDKVVYHVKNHYIVLSGITQDGKIEVLDPVYNAGVEKKGNRSGLYDSIQAINNNPIYRTNDIYGYAFS